MEKATLFRGLNTYREKSDRQAGDRLERSWKVEEGIYAEGSPNEIFSLGLPSALEPFLIN
ncbi:MAG: hypothetical protein V7K67_12475 [Nostoc sp.]|uniref:hypothetical protein n=1 Tax=Nostoc sp. TaxID=1180 RepID=UPI002FF430A5